LQSTYDLSEAPKFSHIDASFSQRGLEHRTESQIRKEKGSSEQVRFSQPLT